MSYHTFMVKTDRYTMLVDTCCGNHKTERPDPNSTSSTPISSARSPTRA